VRLVWTLVGAIIGGVIGYFVGVYVACDWLIPTSNLCGIYAVFFTGPVGAVIGGGIGWSMFRAAAR